MGASRVVASASAAKHALLKELGADEVIDYRTQDYTQVGAEVWGWKCGDVLARGKGVILMLTLHRRHSLASSHLLSSPIVSHTFSVKIPHTPPMRTPSPKGVY